MSKFQGGGWDPRSQTRSSLWAVLATCVAVLGPLATVAHGAGTNAFRQPGYVISLPTSGPARSQPRSVNKGAVAPIVPRRSPFAGRGMWIWQLRNSGSIAKVIHQAKAYGVRTLFIKSGDGAGLWTQFNRGLVRRLHAARLRVCAWQFVYGGDPIGEANVGVNSARDGADCLVIDAEQQYQGRYEAAQRYMNQLRTLLGPRYPIGLAGFPYVDYHPSFPFSVFLGPGAAQYNLPQMYWSMIGTNVPTVFAHTYALNQLYKRPIYPIGQLFGGPPAEQVRAFRAVASRYGAHGLSWWDWQGGGASIWASIRDAALVLSPSFTPYRQPATIGPGAVGDVVVWAQEHLASAGDAVTVDGGYTSATVRAVANFQASHGLAQTGTIDPATWDKLLNYKPIKVRWVLAGGRRTALAAAAGTSPTVSLPQPNKALRGRSDNEFSAEPGMGGTG